MVTDTRVEQPASQIIALQQDFIKILVNHDKTDQELRQKLDIDWTIAKQDGTFTLTLNSYDDAKLERAHFVLGKLQEWAPARPPTSDDIDRAIKIQDEGYTYDITVLDPKNSGKQIPFPASGLKGFSVTERALKTLQTIANADVEIIQDDGEKKALVDITPRYTAQQFSQRQQGILNQTYAAIVTSLRGLAEAKSPSGTEEKEIIKAAFKTITPLGRNKDEAPEIEGNDLSPAPSPVEQEPEVKPALPTSIHRKITLTDNTGIRLPTQFEWTDKPGNEAALDDKTGRFIDFAGEVANHYDVKLDVTTAAEGETRLLFSRTGSHPASMATAPLEYIVKNARPYTLDEVLDFHEPQRILDRTYNPDGTNPPIEISCITDRPISLEAMRPFLHSYECDALYDSDTHAYLVYGKNAQSRAALAATLEDMQPALKKQQDDNKRKDAIRLATTEIHHYGQISTAKGNFVKGLLKDAYDQWDDVQKRRSYRAKHLREIRALEKKADLKPNQKKTLQNKRAKLATLAANNTLREEKRSVQAEIDNLMKIRSLRLHDRSRLEDALSNFDAADTEQEREQYWAEFLDIYQDIQHIHLIRTHSDKLEGTNEAEKSKRDNRLSLLRSARRRSLDFYRGKYAVGLRKERYEQRIEKEMEAKGDKAQIDPFKPREDSNNNNKTRRNNRESYRREKTNYYNSVKRVDELTKTAAQCTPIHMRIRAMTEDDREADTLDHAWNTIKEAIETLNARVTEQGLIARGKSDIAIHEYATPGFTFGEQKKEEFMAAMKKHAPDVEPSILPPPETVKEKTASQKEDVLVKAEKDYTAFIADLQKSSATALSVDDGDGTYFQGTNLVPLADFMASADGRSCLHATVNKALGVGVRVMPLGETGHYKFEILGSSRNKGKAEQALSGLKKLALRFKGDEDQITAKDVQQALATVVSTRSHLREFSKQIDGAFIVSAAAYDFFKGTTVSGSANREEYLEAFLRNHDLKVVAETNAAGEKGINIYRRNKHGNDKGEAVTEIGLVIRILEKEIEKAKQQDKKPQIDRATFSRWVNDPLRELGATLGLTAQAPSSSGAPVKSANKETSLPKPGILKADSAQDERSPLEKRRGSKTHGIIQSIGEWTERIELEPEEEYSGSGKKRNSRSSNTNIQLIEHTYTPFAPLPKEEQPDQSQFFGRKTIRGNALSFLTGPAATGKTFLTSGMGIDFLIASSIPEDQRLDKIIVLREAIGAGEGLGFLPGNLDKKLKPFAEPVFDAIDKQIRNGDTNEGRKMREKLQNNGILIADSIEHLRGRTFDNAFIIVTEAQNLTDQQIVLCLTRLGKNSRMVFEGDPKQIDIPEDLSGLFAVTETLKGNKYTGIHEMSERDATARHPVIKSALEAFKQDPRFQRSMERPSLGAHTFEEVISMVKAVNEDPSVTSYAYMRLSQAFANVSGYEAAQVDRAIAQYFRKNPDEMPASMKSIITGPDAA